MDLNNMKYAELRVVLRCSSSNVCLPAEVLDDIGKVFLEERERSEDVKRLVANFPDWVENVKLILLDQ